MKVYLLRHGETQYNTEKRYLGRTDVPLSRKGREALLRADISPEKVYVSPLLRAAETAEILFPEARLIPVAGLQEMDFGMFEGRNYREMTDWPEYRAWVDGGCVGAIPGGELRADFCERTCAAFSGLVNLALKAGEERLVIVAHGGTQRAVLSRYALPRQGYFSWQMPNGGGYLLDAGRWRQEGVLELLETVQYTKGGEA